MSTLRSCLVLALDSRTLEQESLAAFRKARKLAGDDVEKALDAMGGPVNAGTPPHQRTLTNIGFRMYVALQEVLYESADNLKLSGFRIQLASPENNAAYADFKLFYHQPSPEVNDKFTAYLKHVLNKLSDPEEIVQAVRATHKPKKPIFTDPPVPREPKKGFFSGIFG